MSLQLASHAKTLALPVQAPDCPAPVLDCTGKSFEPFAWYDQSGQCWRTWQLCLVEGWERFSETWPRSGMTRNGIAYRRVPLAPLTGETEYGLLPTPEASNTKAVARRSAGRSPRDFLKPIWPTPRANDAMKRGNFDTQNPRNGLPDAAKRWPTPTATMHKGSSPAALTRKDGRDRSGDRLDHAVMASDSGQLNPDWVEWLMGFPIGWTALKNWVTPSSRKSRK